MYNDPNNPNNPNGNNPSQQQPPDALTQQLSFISPEMLQAIRNQQQQQQQQQFQVVQQQQLQAAQQIQQQQLLAMLRLNNPQFGGPAQPSLAEMVQRVMLQQHLGQGPLNFQNILAPQVQQLQQQQLQAQQPHLVQQQLPPQPPPQQVFAPPPIQAQPTPPPAPQQARIPAQYVEQFIAQEEANAAAPRIPSPPPLPRPAPPPPPQINIPVLHVPALPVPVPVHQQQQQQIQQQQQQQAAPQEQVVLPAVEEEEPPRRRRGGGRKRRAPADAPPRVDEALAYLRVIKQTFADDVPVYHKFLEIMKDFRAQRIDTPVVIEQVADLLYQSPDLVLGFNTFLPAGYRISFTDDRQHYVFTSPQNQPRVLESPEERAAAAQAAQAENREQSDSGNEEEQTENEESAANSEEEEDESRDEEQILVEEVIRFDSDEEMIDEKTREEVLHEASEATLSLISLLKVCFAARPERLVGFLAFMDTYLAHCHYYAMEDQESPEELKQEDSEKAGPAPKPRQPDSENNEEVKQEVPAVKKTRSLEPLNEQHIATMLANVCQGEPHLLAASLDFMPHLKTVIVQLGVECEDLIRRIDDILNDSTDGIPQNIAQLDSQLHQELERMRIGTPSKEKLRVLAKIEGNETQELLVLNKTNRVIYEHLKARTTQMQLKKLLTLMNMYTNMDISAEDFVTELPRVMGVHDSHAEAIIRKMLGMEKTPTEKAESDPDAVMKCDVPIQKQKRGLREQKTMEQVKVVSGATVCTLGPSYRLMVKEKKETCEGRREMDSLLKEVLNDTWTSYPSWSSEEAGTTTAKKSNLEEFHYKTEDERYELDIIVDSNRTIIEQISKVLADIYTLPPEQRKLDETLNCPSKSTLLRVLTKVYTNQVFSVIEAAQKNPADGLKKILGALKEKDAIWSKFQQETNRTWRDVLDKTLSANINVLSNQQKQYDQKAFKSKPLVTAIETVYEERKKTNTDDDRPHMTLEYTPERRVYRDVNDVTGHFFVDLAGGKHEKDRSKIVLFRVLMDWVGQPHQNVEINTGSTDTFTFQGDEVEDDNLLALLSLDGPTVTSSSHDTFSILSPTGSSRTERFQRDLHRLQKKVFYGDDNVYMIIRYHHMIMERFTKILATQAVLNQEYLETQAKHQRWQLGAGAEMRGQKVLEENIRIRQEAVNDIRNIRSCPSAYYDQTLREMKSLGNGQTDTVAFEEAIKLLFPGDVVLFNSIDKLFNSLAKNIHHATCAESKENPIKMYLKYRSLMDNCQNEEELEKVLTEYSLEAEEMLDGKNTYRFEFVQEKNAPFCNIWVIPREEKEDSEDEEEEKEEEKEKEEEEKGPSNSEDDEEMEEQPTSSGGIEENMEEAPTE